MRRRRTEYQDNSVAMRPLKRYARLGLPGLAAIVFLASCNDVALNSTRSDPQKGTTPTAEQAAYGRFTDLPIPEGATMDAERSLILGTGDNWLGRVALNTEGDVAEIFDFYRREMPRFGWTEITVVRAEASVLTYENGSRVATVQIGKSTLGGADLDLTVSPRGMAVQQLQ
jgi:hypothetical protein